MVTIRKFIERYFTLCGFTGLGGILIALLLPQLAFRNREGQSYSLSNHFVSELGWLEVSEFAFVFNAGLFLGGLFFAVYIIGVSLQFKGLWAVLTGLTGAIAAVAVSMVGVFPVTGHWFGLFLHGAAATASGVATYISVVTFALMVWFNNPGQISRLFIIYCLLILGCFASGLLIRINRDVLPFMDFENIKIINRPDRWIIPIVEWAIVISVISGLGFSAIYFEIRKRRLKNCS